MYGSGLRLLECLRLRVKDLDFDRREITVRNGKGSKDRRTPLAEVCVGPLRDHLSVSLAEYRHDRRHRAGAPIPPRPGRAESR